MQGGPHLAFAVRASEDDVKPRVAGLEPLGECDRRQGLAEGARKADERIVLPGHAGEALVEVRANLRPHLQDFAITVGAVRLGPLVLERLGERGVHHLGEVALRGWDAVAEHLGGEDPVPQQEVGHEVGDTIVPPGADAPGKVEIEVADVAGEVVAGQAGLQQAKSQRRASDVCEWHRDEQNALHHSTPFTRSPIS